MQETLVRFLGWEDPWRRKWQPTPVFLPEEAHGQRSLVGSVQGLTESQTRLSDQAQHSTFGLSWILLAALGIFFTFYFFSCSIWDLVP